MREKRSILVPAVLGAVLKFGVPSGVRLPPIGLPHGKPLDKYSSTDLKLGPQLLTPIILQSCRVVLFFFPKTLS